MSQQIGVPPPASVVETTPPSHTTTQLTTTATAAAATSSASHPSMPPSEQFPAHVDPFFKPPPDISKTSSGTITGKVEIPKLSAATTELLARVTGSIKGGAKRDSHEPDIATSLKNNNWNNTQGVANMNASAFLDFPPAQFASPATAQSTTTSTSVPGQGNYTMKSSTGLINLAPKTAVPASSRLQSQPQGTTAPATTAGATPVKRQSAPNARQTASNGAKRTTKRRRRGVDDDEEGIIRAGDSSSDESDITPIATQTKSGRQVHRPSLYVPPASSPPASNRNSATNTPDNLAAATTAAARKRKRVVRKGKEVNISCIHCQRGHSPLTNTIVFCDWCNRAWHQLCHDPRIDDEVVQVKEKEWLCKVCKPVPLLDFQPTVVRSNPNLPSQFTRIPIETPPLEIGGAGISDDHRRGYLSSLSHASLVELLATLSDRNPDLPMFPEHLKTLPSSKFSFQSSIPTAAPGLITPPTAASSNQELNNGTSIAGDAGDSTAEAPPAGGSSSTKQKHHGLADDDDESEYEIFEDHRLYPRAGNGLRLSLQKDDLDILREDPACPTFSYSLHGPAKDRAEANDAAPVWGTA